MPKVSPRVLRLELGLEDALLLLAYLTAWVSVTHQSLIDGLI